MAKKIMVIEDEPDILVYLMAVLEDNGYQTCSIQEHDAIDEALSRHQPDMLIMDVMMPKRSGISIYKEMRNSSAFADIPVVLITGVSPEVEMLGDGFGLLGDDPGVAPPNAMIEKPIHIKSLMDLVGKLLITKDADSDSSPQRT